MSATKKQSPRALAAKIVADVLTKPVFSNVRLDEVLKESPLDPRDRGFCTELVYGTLRWKIPLEQSIRAALDKPGKISPKVFSHFLIAAYQLQHMTDSIPAHAAVNEAVALIKRIAPGLSGLANAVLRRLGSRRDHQIVFDKASPQELAFAYGLPEKLVETVQKEIPKEEWRDAVVAFKSRPKVYFRFLQGEPTGQDFHPHAFVPRAYFKNENQDLVRMLSKNAVVQDPASQMAALILAPNLGSKVVDMCAAPGMKSLILKNEVGPKGTVLSIDANSNKRARMEENMRRLQLPFELRIEDAREFSKREKYQGYFDYVMLDAPCSGLGTIRRHPEIAIRFAKENVVQISQLQRELLDGAARLLKSGGAMVYSVCSPLAEEGREQVAWFLSQHPDFAIENPLNSCPWLSKDCVTSEKFVALWPHRHDADAFFAVRLIKR